MNQGSQVKMCWLVVVGLISVGYAKEMVLQPLGVLAAVNESSSSPMTTDIMVSYRAMPGGSNSNRVGSVYFDWGRIRGPHDQGPLKEPIRSGWTRTAYNWNDNVLYEGQKKKLKQKYARQCIRWGYTPRTVLDCICQLIVQNKVRPSPAQLHLNTLPTKEQHDPNLSLWECFQVPEQGRAVTTQFRGHKSRGMAVKMPIGRRCRKKLESLLQRPDVLPTTPLPPAADQSTYHKAVDLRNRKWTNFWRAVPQSDLGQDTFCKHELRILYGTLHDT